MVMVMMVLMGVFVGEIMLDWIGLDCCCYWSVVVVVVVVVVIVVVLGVTS